MIKYIWILLICFSVSGTAADLLDYLPQNSKIVIQGNISQLVKFPCCNRLFNSHSDIHLQNMASQAVFTTTDFNQNCYMMFCKTPLKEAEFAAMLQKDSRIITVSQQKTGKYITRQLSVSLPENMEKQSIYVTFLATDIVLLSNEKFSIYQHQKTGLSKTHRQWLPANTMLSGYILPDQTANQFYPAASKVKKVLFSAILQKNDSLGLSITITPTQKINQEQFNMQAQQTILLLGMILNRFDPALTQEFTRSIEVFDEKDDVMIRGNFSRSFIDRFTNVLNLLTTSSDAPQRINQNSPAKMRKDH